MLIPIGTDVRPRSSPVANWVLIGLNVAVFLYTDVLSGPAGERLKSYYALDAARPAIFQYLTYQFLHGDAIHLVGNMLFLWIFGNAVCDRMGGLAYLLFYLAGGVFAGVAFAATAENPMVGASGAIAAVTTAFLALYPRVHITMLLWMFVVFPFQIPAMILIVFKIILWDNIITPSMERGAASNVAYSAHLGGYAFGFAVALALLYFNALPRHQFDVVGVLDRWRRRNGLGGGPPLGRIGAARPVLVEEVGSRPLDELPLTPIEQLREQIAQRIADRDVRGAADDYRELQRLDAAQVLPRQQQLDVANHYWHAGDYAAASRAYEAFLVAYPASPEVYQVRLLLGLIYARHLHDYSRAAKYLRQALAGLSVQSQRELAEEELRLAEERAYGPRGGE